MEMMKRGSIVFWNIPEIVKTDSDMVSDYGLTDHEPRNDSKAALIKAIKAAKKKFGWYEDEKHHRMNPQHLKPIDTVEQTVWEIHKPRLGETETEWSLIARVIYGKKERSLEIQGSDEVKQFFIDNYRTSAVSLDNTQVAGIINRAINRHSPSCCAGVTMRVSGGVYFVPADRQRQLDNVGAFLSAIGGTLYQCPLYSDSDATIESVTATEITTELSREIDRLRSETQSLNGRMLETRIDRVNDLAAKARLHSDRLRSSYTRIDSDIRTLLSVLERHVPGSARDEVAFDLDTEMAKIVEATRLDFGRDG